MKLTALTIGLLFCTPWLLSASAARAASRGNIDLSSGIVFPTNNSAIDENGATLGGFSAKSSLDVSTGWNSHNSPDGLQASYARGGGGKGFGIGVSHFGGDTAATGAGGWDLGGVELGLAGAYDFSPQTFTLDVGSRFGSENFMMAIVLDNVLKFNRRWHLGVGSAIMKSVILEEDFNFQHGSDLTTLSTIDGTFCITANNSRSISIKLGFPHDLYPSPKFDLSRTQVGLSFWLGDSVGMYGLYQVPTTTFQVGLRIQ